MYHEFAHHVHQMKYVNNNPDYGVRFIPLVEKKLTQVVARQSATKYGSTNNKEWFAENFSLYEMGRKDIVDPRFIQFIESEM
jgi:UDP-N-acetylmuramate-alanine ligase